MGFGVSQRSKALKTLCPKNFMLLWSIALLVVPVTTSLTIYELYENSKGVSSPSLGSIIGTYNSNSD